MIKKQREWKNILVCPHCREQLVDHTQGLKCIKEKIIFPIIDGIPVLLLSEAIREEISDDMGYLI